jgi:DmsE family decaheme c-type cytochrome
MGAITPALAADPPAVDRTLEGDAVCTKCHDQSWDKPILAIYQTRHGNKADERTPGCQTCHGASSSHLQSPGNSPDVTFGAKSKADSQARNEVCLNCHKKDARRDHWEGSKHDRRGLACASCHTVHAAADKVLTKATQSEVCFACHKTERAQTLRMSTHPIAAGKVACSDCHNPHGSAGPKQLVKDTVNETCFVCHAEKRGPFLFDHASASDDCMNCHTPHGSTNAPLLKGRSPWLCQQCHSGTTPHPGNVYSATGLPGGAVTNANQSAATAANTNPITGAAVTRNNPVVQLAYRGCTNCHSMVHGSNHPSGVYLLR